MKQDRLNFCFGLCGVQHCFNYLGTISCKRIPSYLNLGLPSLKMILVNWSQKILTLPSLYSFQAQTHYQGHPILNSQHVKVNWNYIHVDGFHASNNSCAPVWTGWIGKCQMVFSQCRWQRSTNVLQWCEGKPYGLPLHRNQLPTRQTFCIK